MKSNPEKDRATKPVWGAGIAPGSSHRTVKTVSDGEPVRLLTGEWGREGPKSAARTPPTAILSGRSSIAARLGRDGPAPDRREGAGASPRSVDVEFAQSDAQACAAVGCAEGDNLLVVRKAGKQRVLCPLHARRWAKQ
jgi:hypothetical protein